MGLRYTDDCPIKEITINSFKEFYNSGFPFHRFDIEDSKNMEFKTDLRRGNYFLIYRETFTNEKGIGKFIIDFDGYAEDVDSSKVMETTDKLHIIISEEYEATIKEPVYEFMRKGKLNE